MNIRRIRFATKGPAVMPQKILTDDPWLDALTAVVEKGRKLHKEVVIHTHFNHPNEITGITEDAMNRLMERAATFDQLRFVDLQIDPAVFEAGFA